MIPIEDNFSDIISKAQRGLRLSDSELAEKARVSSQKVRELCEGTFDELALLRVAGALGLSGRALADLATDAWRPPVIGEIEGLAQFSTQYHGMAVNAYLVWDAESRVAAVFDTGADSREMLGFAGKKKLTIKMILLTHTHPDHIDDLPRLREETGAAVYVSKHESFSGAESIDEGKSFTLGKLKIEVRLTWGHSRGGLTYVVTGLMRPVAVVGDSLFAGSMGGGNVSYEDAVRNNIEKILTLPDDAIICPGHGPMTTVAEEKAHNPFFAERL
jgi:hydroxyacylglutathione hydrolase